ncbi:MAG TPA: DoxX family protein [Pirellulaceae bacterium]|nr:DoxX family protein [Pirellulaceae bacterium]
MSTATPTPPANPKWMTWLGWVLTILPSLLLVFSAVMKFVGPPEVKDGFTKAGWNPNLLLPLGLTELACTILYLVPQTSTLGAVLLTGYMGGAIAHHLRLGEPIAFQVAFGVVIWLGLFLREPRLRAILPIRSPNATTTRP